MVDAHGNPLAITDLGPNEAAAIAAFEVYRGVVGSSDERHARGSLRVRMVDHLKALELYGKAMAYYADRREITGAEGAPLSITVEFVDPPEHDPTAASWQSRRP